MLNKIDVELYNGIKVGKHTITHDGKNVYIDDKRVLAQWSREGVYISKFAWNGNTHSWDAFLPEEVLKNNKVNYYKVVIAFIERLILFPLQEYIDSINCRKYFNL